MNNSLKIFFWAMMHSSGFKYCYVRSPISVNLLFDGYGGLLIKIFLRSPSVFVPWHVRNEYWEAQGVIEEVPF